MKNYCAVTLFALLAVSLAAANEQAGNTKVLNGRAISSTLFLNNPFDAGDWGSAETCPDGSFVHAFEVLFFPPGAIDETAVNALKLYCSTEDNHDDGYVTSATSPDGDWYGMRVCTEQFMTGFRGKVLEYQGLFTDDVAVQDFEAECNYGSEIVGGIDVESKFNDGEWSVWVACPAESAVCGLQTRVEKPQLADDDTAITDINLFCCPLSAGSVTAKAGPTL